MRPLSNPFRLFDISSLFGMSTEKPFRLMDLPREIRDKIYHEILCDWGLQDTALSVITNDRNEIQFQATTNKVEPNIMLANKQVYEEAKQIFLKGNQFVHIRMTAIPNIIHGAFGREQITVVASGRDNVARFKDLVVMKHTIEFPGDESPLPKFEIDVIMLKQDLWTFSEGVALVDIHFRRFAGHSKHDITIFNPFAKTQSPDFLNAKNLRHLLKPYIMRFQGFDDVKVQGKIAPYQAAAVVATINREPPLPSPPNILDTIMKWNDGGNHFFLERDYSMALLSWNAGELAIMAMRNRKAWAPLMETVGKDFTDHISDLAFQVEMGRARACIEMRQAALRDDDSDQRAPPSGWIGQITTACVDAMEIGKILGTDWTPSHDQTATVFFNWAKGHRVADGDVHFAEDAIRRADHLRPDDEEIGSEMENIVEWKHSMGLP